MKLNFQKANINDSNINESKIFDENLDVEISRFSDTTIKI